MHLIRLYLMCIDILEKGEVITYRAAEHDFLMRIRNGEYLDENQQPTAEFFEIIEQYKARAAYAAEHTDLPERPDEKKIRELVLAIHEKIVLEEQ